MKYKVSKASDDGRYSTFGYMLPDGYYRVIGLTRFNGEQLLGFEKLGYVVEELPEDDATLAGLYQASTGQRVVDSTVADASMRSPR
jgi:hypothetical protein